MFLAHQLAEYQYHTQKYMISSMNSIEYVHTTLLSLLNVFKKITNNANKIRKETKI